MTDARPPRSTPGRGSAASPRRRPHAALASRVLVTGLAAGTSVGLIGVMARADQVAAEPPPPAELGYGPMGAVGYLTGAYGAIAATPPPIVTTTTTAPPASTTAPAATPGAALVDTGGASAPAPAGPSSTGTAPSPAPVAPAPVAAPPVTAPAPPPQPVVTAPPVTAPPVQAPPASSTGAS